MLTGSENKRSAFYSISSVLPSYFSQEFSFTKFTAPDNSQTQIVFLENRTMHVITDQGHHYKMLVNIDTNKEIAVDSAIITNFLEQK